MKKIITCLSLLVVLHSVAQNSQNANWCFGLNAGVNFNTASPTPFTSQSSYSLPNSSYSSLGTPASVSNENGQLLFYTNGMTVWNNASPVNQPMQNGTGLYGAIDIVWDNQSTVIVPKPKHPGIYYIFTLSFFYNAPFNPTGIYGGAHYSVVDMNLDGGKGDVVTNLKNIKLKDHSGVPIEYDYAGATGLKMTIGKITTAMHNDNDKIWVTIFPRFDIGGQVTRYAYSYLVTENGINNLPDGTSPQPIVPTLPATVLLDNVNYDASTNPINEPYGSIKISPNGQLLCDATNRINLYNFNDQNGEVTFNRNVFTPTANTYIGHGIEFSPSSQYIYFSDYFYNTITQDKNNASSSIVEKYAKIYQNPVGTIKKREVWSSQVPNFVTIPADRPFALQLAINNQIYVAMPDGMTQTGSILGAIELPNLLAPSCNFNPFSLTLVTGTSHSGSLPQWVHKAVWPKVYEGKSPLYLGKDNNSNLFMFIHEAAFNIPPINHDGPLPAPSNNSIELSFQYTNTGITNWYKTDLKPSIALNSGDIQMHYYNYPPLITSYYNGTSGTQSYPPLPTNEIIIAETNQNSIISESYYGIIYVHSPTGTSPPLNLGGPILKTIFNPNTNKLFISWYTSSGNFFSVYTLNPANTLDLNVTQLLPPDNPNLFPTTLVQVTTQDKVYMVKDEILREYLYISNTFGTPINIAGFNNVNIWSIKSNNPYTEDICLVAQRVDNDIYAINFSTSAITEKKIHISQYDPVMFSYAYVFSGDYVYLAGTVSDNTTYIGSQHIPLLPTSNHSVFLTKLSLTGDFILRPAAISTVTTPLENKASFEVNISPNPSVNLVRFLITEKGMQSISTYTLSIVNQEGDPVLKKEKYTSGLNLDISGLKMGIYYIEITNSSGEKLSKNIIKL